MKRKPNHMHWVAALNLIKDIQDALGTAEEGEALVEVARNAHRAEQNVGRLVTLIFKAELVPYGGANTLTFIDAQAKDGICIADEDLGEWATDGEYETLTVILK